MTKVLPSASVEGHVKTNRGCADSDFSLWLWLNGNRPTAVQLGNLNEGDAFTISGLPEGTHVLGGVGRHIPVTLKAGGHVTQDVTFAVPRREHRDQHSDHHPAGGAAPERHPDA